MAFSVTTEPGVELVMSRSPILIACFDDAIVDPSYRFRLKVYVWDGDETDPPAIPTETLIQNPDDVGRATFNIDWLLQDRLDQLDPDRADESGATLIENFYYIAGWVTDEDAADEVTSDVFRFTEGWSKAPQGLNNYELSGRITTSIDFMTPRIENIYLVDDRPFWLFTYFNQLDNTRRIRVTDSFGNEWIQPMEDQAAANPPVDASDFIIGWDFSADGLDAVGIEPVGKVVVRIESFLAVWTNALTVNLHFKESELCDQETECLAYINRYGVWDYLHCLGKQRLGLSQQSNRFDRRIGRYNSLNAYTYDIETSPVGVKGVELDLRHIINTGNQGDEINEKLIDIMASKKWFSFQLGAPVELVTSNLDLKQESDEGSLNYTLEFRQAANLIQNVQ